MDRCEGDWYASDNNLRGTPHGRNLWNLICLPNTYTIKNSLELAIELNNIQINENNRIITLDIKDLYGNLPTKNFLHITEFWLNKGNQDQLTIHQTLYLLETILKQNYFQHNNQFYQPNKGIAMGSPISGMLAEIYLQYLEETHKTLFRKQGNNLL